MTISHHPSGAPRDVVAVLREHQRELLDHRAALEMRRREHEREIDTLTAELSELGRALSSVDTTLQAIGRAAEKRAKPAPTQPIPKTEETAP